MGNHVLTFEELTTLFCQVESILNSRPIGVLSEDPKDGEILTPAHLICRTKLETFPTIETPRKNEIANCISTARWVHIQNVLLHFWKRWHKEYVTSLQERKKWGKEVTNLKVGDVIFITDDNVAPLQWPLGRIFYVYNGCAILCELSKFERNLASTTELYTNSKNCLYLLTKKLLPYLDLL